MFYAQVALSQHRGEGRGNHIVEKRGVVKRESERGKTTEEEEEEGEEDEAHYHHKGGERRAICLSRLHFGVLVGERHEFALFGRTLCRKKWESE